MKHRCPTCKRLFVKPELRNPEQVKYFPFCSQRCKLIDLGHWLDSDYRIMTNRESQDDEPSGRPPDKRGKTT